MALLLSTGWHKLQLIAYHGLDESWWIDHGTLSELTRMYPEADISVVQLSLDRGMGSHEHINLAKQLLPLRDEGILVIVTACR